MALDDTDDLLEPNTGGKSRASSRQSLSAAVDKRLGRIKRFGPVRQSRGERAPFVSHASDPRQRVIVKVHYFSHAGGGGAAMRAHGRYISRDGAARDDGGDEALDQAPRETEVERAHAHARYLSREAQTAFYDRNDHGVEGAARMAAWSRADARHFRVILAAENGGQISDLQAYVREVMARAEEMLARGKLEWVAVDHWDTDNPHTHIVLRGRLANGHPLGLPRDFVRRQFREIARDVASERLGPRARDEERLALEREVRRHGLTRLDRFIEKQMDENREVRLAKLGRSIEDPDLARNIRSRVEELKRLGLADEAGKGRVKFARDWQGRLDEMEKHLDVRRSLMQERRFARDFDRAGERLSKETG